MNTTLVAVLVAKYTGLKDSAVDQVAREGGTLSDFAKYQKKEKLTFLDAN